MVVQILEHLATKTKDLNPVHSYLLPMIIRNFNSILKINLERGLIILLTNTMTILTTIITTTTKMTVKMIIMIDQIFPLPTKIKIMIIQVVPTTTPLTIGNKLECGVKIWTT